MWVQNETISVDKHVGKRMFWGRWVTGSPTAMGEKKEMRFTQITSTKNLNTFRLLELMSADPKHPHVHIVDFPYRATSTWQDHDCDFGVWKKDDEILAWAVFQPAWWNLDYAVHPLERGSNLEKEIFAWGKEQMMVYGNRTGEDFYGSVEFFENASNTEQTIETLVLLGFEKFDWSTIRFEIDLHQDFPRPQLPDGYMIRPLHGKSEVQEYVSLHRAVFGSEKMTTEWRMRMLEHPSYRPEIDLVVVNTENKLVGFCICWLWQDIGQIEPLGVHPDYQGIGLGRALELAAYQTLRNHGVRYLNVDHVSLNEKAIALSLKNGFRQNNNALRFYVDTSQH
jgi:ribosomal protein S18 acetylase RimI-like enzyme